MNKRKRFILRSLLIVLTSITLVVFLSIKISSNTKEAKTNNSIIIVYQGEKIQFKNENDKKLTKFIEDQKIIIEKEIKTKYNYNTIELDYKLVKKNDKTFTLSLFGSFDTIDTSIIDDNSLEVSEVVFKDGSNAISFVVNDKIEYNFDEKKQFRIGTVNNDVNNGEYFIANNPSSYTAVINKNRRFLSNYVPSDLVNITVSSQKSGESNKIRSDVLTNLEKMFTDAKNQGVNLTVTSAYRSYSTQEKLFNDYTSQYGAEQASKFSAYPGASEHQSGLVVDIGSLSNMSTNFEAEFGNTSEGIWLRDNAYKYGFILRYPQGKEDITTYIYEPWHFRYVGYDLAEYVTTNNLTLEEFFKLT